VIRLSLFLAVLLTVTGPAASAQSRESQYWLKQRSSPTFSDWARCVDERSEALLTDFFDNFGRLPDLNDAKKRPTSAQIFPRVLAACETKMTGFAWESLPDKTFRRMIDEATKQFKVIENRIHDNIDQAGI
jgi:hypothetical protein